MLNGQGVVLALMLLMYAITAISIISRIVNPNKPETKATPGMLMFSLFVNFLLATGACYLASN